MRDRGLHAARRARAVKIAGLQAVQHGPEEAPIRTSLFRLLRLLFRMLPIDEVRRDSARHWFTRYLGDWLVPASSGIDLGSFSRDRAARRDPRTRAIGWRAPASAAVADDGLRCVAFYLPQFHPIPENDAAWGEGFTEWTNVRRALPRFEGHVQPRLPGELGEYDLRDPAVLHKQARLAREHGVDAFCFYHYWFGGQQPLIAPLRAWLADPGIDLSFCLCWANESWTRRWDGRDREIILEQRHTGEDDLAWIAAVADYMRDPRYLRVDGRPLLLIYRPSLLPDARASAARWRDWCASNGIGEIHLACVQSLDHAGPEAYGFDSAVAFPPNDARARDLSDLQVAAVAGGPGEVRDWRDVASAHMAAIQPAYRRFPAVNPGWDNEPRRAGRGRTFVHAAPRRYRDWLAWTIQAERARPAAGDRLVFINAWNEWAEGAILEPDARLGHAWLQAHRAARAQAVRKPQTTLPPAERSPCVVVHAWYPEVLEELLAVQAARGGACRWVVTTAPEREHGVREVLAACGMEARILVCENRGRDILPFLHAADMLLDEGEDVVLKLHTKRSPQRDDGDHWRRTLVAGLAGEDRAAAAMRRFTQEERLGLLSAPDGLRRIADQSGGNRAAFEYLCSRIGLRDRRWKRARFAPGSMFWVRLEALRPLLDAHLGVWEFEAEAGQLDGTLAHAIERLFGAVVNDAGYAIAELD